MIKQTIYNTFSSYNSHFDISINQHGMYFGNSTWNHANVNSPYHRLYFTISGKPMIEINSKEIILQPNKIYLIPAHTIFSYNSSEEFNKFYLHFNAYLYGCFDVFNQIHDCMDIDFDKDMMNKYISCIKSDFLSDQIQGKIIFMDILNQFIRKYDINLDIFFKKQSFLKSVYEYIFENYSIYLDQSQLTDAFEVKLGTLNKYFKEQNSITIKQYNDNFILNQSQIMLASSKVSINEIAIKLGFNDPYYFSKFFKKRTGVSPLKYRKSQIIVK